MVTLTIFAEKLQIHSKSVYFSSVGEVKSYTKIYNILQEIEFFLPDYYDNFAFFEQFSFLKKVGDFIFIELTFQSKKALEDFIKENCIFNGGLKKMKLKTDFEKTFLYVFERVLLIYDNENVQLI